MNKRNTMRDSRNRSKDREHCTRNILITPTCRRKLVEQTNINKKYMEANTRSWTN